MSMDALNEVLWNIKGVQSILLKLSSCEEYRDMPESDMFFILSEMLYTTAQSIEELLQKEDSNLMEK